MARRLLSLAASRADVGQRCQAVSGPAFLSKAWQPALLELQAPNMTSYMTQSAFAVPETSCVLPAELGTPRMEWLPRQTGPLPLRFQDAQTAFASHSSSHLARSWAVFSACGAQPLVKRADTVLAALKQAFGRTVVNAAVKRTVFAHFCAGETADEVKPRLRQLHHNGIGGILAYSCENDVASEDSAIPGSAAEPCTFCDTFEAQCDRHVATNMKAILAAAANEGRGFSAIKVTALMHPVLLERASAALLAGGPGVLASALTRTELALLDDVWRRLTALATLAAELGVRLIIDAEHSYFQPLINHVAVELQRRYNASEAVIMNTYQGYRKDAHQRLITDMERAEQEGFAFGAKLVRGAYLVLERERAAAAGADSPIYDTIEDTHANYGRCVAEMLRQVAAGNGTEVMIATHNQASLEAAVGLMAELGISPCDSGVAFGQLQGMADHLTFTLGRNGYRAYKYMPFGLVDDVIPYLIRRAQENSDMMGGINHEMRLLQGELKRRLIEKLGLRNTTQPAEVAPAVAAAT